jgi:hypothetical protein
MAEAVARRGHEVHVVTYHRRGGGRRALRRPPDPRRPQLSPHRSRPHGPEALPARPDARGPAAPPASRAPLRPRPRASLQRDCSSRPAAVPDVPIVVRRLTLLTSELPTYPPGCHAADPGGGSVARRSPAPTGRPHHRRQRRIRDGLTTRRPGARALHVIPSGVEWERFPAERGVRRTVTPSSSPATSPLSG